MAKMRKVPSAPTSSASLLANTEAKSHWCMSVHRRFAAHRQAAFKLARRDTEGGDDDEVDQRRDGVGFQRPESLLRDLVGGEQQVGVGDGRYQGSRLHELDG